ncbi:MAG: DUF3368 domain-containing protein [Lachnospiraceae bacterium]|nr:DUF3368 domain-containing protein [Lachnospiraceae bacterium]
MATAARVKYPDACIATSLMPRMLASGYLTVVQKVRNLQAISILRNVTGLDAGESEALILYGEQCADLLLMDENKGRKVAKQMDIKHIGTVGVLLEAYTREILKSYEVETCLEVMLKSEIRLSKELCNMVLEYVGLPKRY